MVNIATKICRNCNQKKPLDQFYWHLSMRDKHRSDCKICFQEKRHDYQQVYNIERRHTKAYKQWQHEYEKTTEYQEAHREHAAQYRQQYPERIQACNLVNNSLRNGRLSRQFCEVCGTFQNVEAHHKDYSKPLDIDWLCSKCHALYHRNIRSLKWQL